jgi:hypothetical protein
MVPRESWLVGAEGADRVAIVLANQESDVSFSYVEERLEYGISVGDPLGKGLHAWFSRSSLILQSFVPEELALLNKEQPNDMIFWPHLPSVSHHVREGLGLEWRLTPVNLYSPLALLIHDEISAGQGLIIASFAFMDGEDLRDLPPHSVFSLGDITYVYISQPWNTEDLERLLIRATQIFYDVACVTPAELKTGAHNELIECGRRASMGIVGAFDGDGHLIWRRRELE